MRVAFVSDGGSTRASIGKLTAPAMAGDRPGSSARAASGSSTSLGSPRGACHATERFISSSPSPVSATYSPPERR
jgi:hypothetical protein